MGNFSILNNVAALYAQNQLGVTSSNLTQVITRLSSGKRINSGADDAAGLIIADCLQANIRALDQSVRNANDCISVGQIADSALQEISNLLTRSVTLAEEAASGSIDSTGRTSLKAEYDQIQAEIARIATNTNFNGTMIFTTTGLNGNLSVYVGDIVGSSSISVAFKAITTSGSTVTSLGGQNDNLASVSFLNTTTATSALTTIKNALMAVSSSRGSIGAGSNRLQSAVSVMQSQSINTQAAESTIRDANMAQEISNLTKYQILSQTGAAALAQANAKTNIVVSLLKG